MTMTAGTSRAVLLNTLREQWQASEVAVRQCVDAFEVPASERWTVGDVFRHLVGVAHRVAPDLLTEAFRTAEVTPGPPGINEREVANFKHLTARMVQIELGVAHATVWMFLQRYSDEDLARRIKRSEGELSWGEFLALLCGDHERQHVEQAKRAAGTKLKPPTPFHPWS